MNILFIHQDFPGQFRHLAPALVAAGHRVFALTIKQHPGSTWQGVEVVNYLPGRSSTPAIHPWLVDFETKTIRGEACFRAALQLKAQGFEPDVIVAHHGWGESLFLREAWPQARMGIYCEFYYHAKGADVGFDPEFSAQYEIESCRVRLKNLNNLLHMETADAGLSPTRWQADTFPVPFRDKITVIHDGIDTTTVRENPAISLVLDDKVSLTREHEVITFVNRNLEPYRGYHVFMRSLPRLLRERPAAHVLIVGGDGVSYGAKSDPQRYGGRSWKQIFIDEVRHEIPASDWGRVHFLGNLPFAQHLAVLQLSRCHVYLTYPFVLSWSLLEAMSVGCPVVAGDTAPVREVIRHDETGLLVDFFDRDALVHSIGELLDNPDRAGRLGRAARAFVVDHYDLKSVCLPAQLAWIDGLARR